ncbi:MAG: glycosyltransferase family 39 protein [Pseudomonadota bacterium]
MSHRAARSNRDRIPGETLASRPQARVLMLIVAALTLPGLWQMPTLDRDEARFAQTTKQMLESGDFLRIRFHNEARNKKPHGIHWLQAATVSMTNISRASADEPTAIWAYRLPSVLGMAMAIFGVWVLGWHLVDQVAGWRAAILFGAGPVAMAEATIAKTDAMLTGLVVLTMLALAKLMVPSATAATVNGAQTVRGNFIWILTFWLGLTAAILVKGPIAPMVVGFTLFGLFVGRRMMAPPLPSSPWQSLRPGVGLTIMTMILAPWALATHGATQGQFFADALGGDFLGKVATVQEFHAGPPGYFLILLPILLWPLAGLLPRLVHQAFAARKETSARFFTVPLLFLLAWLVPAWLAFEVSSTKLPHYTLPLYPALALLGAMALRQPIAPAPAWTRWLGSVLLVGVGLAVSVGVITLPMLYNSSGASISAYAAALATIALSGRAAFALWQNRPVQMAGITALTSWFACAVFLTSTLPGLDRLGLSERLAEVAGAFPAEKTYLLGYREPSAVFLLGTQITFVADENALIAGLSSDFGTLAIVEARAAPAFETSAARAGLTLTPLAKIDGFNYSNGNAAKLLIYRRDRNDRHTAHTSSPLQELTQAR